MATILSDGMNLNGKVEGVPGAWPTLQFTYRLAKDYWAFQYDRLSFLPIERADDVSNTITNILKEHLIDVAAVGDSKVPERVELDATNLGMVPGPVRLLMCEYILGRRAPIADSLLPK